MYLLWNLLQLRQSEANIYEAFIILVLTEKFPLKNNKIIMSAFLLRNWGSLKSCTTMRRNSLK